MTNQTILNILPYIQIIISILLIISVLLQQTGAAVGAGDAFGGGNGTIAPTRRGLEKTLLKVTINLSNLFFILSIWALYLKPTELIKDNYTFIGASLIWFLFICLLVKRIK